jgi:hypothetical protein
MTEPRQPLDRLTILEEEGDSKIVLCESSRFTLGNEGPVNLTEKIWQWDWERRRLPRRPLHVYFFTWAAR